MSVLAKVRSALLPSRSSLELTEPLPRSIAAQPVRICGAAGCTSGWLKPWKSRQRPVFEDDWACSHRCLAKMVAQAVLRETGGTFQAVDEAPHKHRIPLGLVLLAQGWITHPQLQGALAAQRESGQGRIGDWLAERCGLAEDRIARGLGVQWNCPVLTMEGFSAKAMALMLPKRFVAEFKMVPIRVAGTRILYVAFQETLHTAAALGLEHMSGLQVEGGLLTSSQLEVARKRVMEAESVPVQLRTVTDADDLTAALLRLLEQRQPVASRLVRMNEYFWMRMWTGETSTVKEQMNQTGADDVEDHIFLSQDSR